MQLAEMNYKTSISIDSLVSNNTPKQDYDKAHITSSCIFDLKKQKSSYIAMVDNIFFKTHFVWNKTVLKHYVYK